MVFKVVVHLLTRPLSNEVTGGFETIEFEVLSRDEVVEILKRHFPKRELVPENFFVRLRPDRLDVYLPCVGRVKTIHDVLREAGNERCAFGEILRKLASLLSDLYDKKIRVRRNVSYLPRDEYERILNKAFEVMAVPVRILSDRFLYYPEAYADYRLVLFFDVLMSDERPPETFAAEFFDVVLEAPRMFSYQLPPDLYLIAHAYTVNEDSVPLILPIDRHYRPKPRREPSVDPLEAFERVRKRGIEAFVELVSRLDSPSPYHEAYMESSALMYARTTDAISGEISLEDYIKVRKTLKRVKLVPSPLYGKVL